jgi:hypothetical protein
MATRSTRISRVSRTRNTITGFAATKGRRGVIKQAALDLEAGQRDTDCRGTARRKPGANRKAG